MQGPLSPRGWTCSRVHALSNASEKQGPVTCASSPPLSSPFPTRSPQRDRKCNAATSAKCDRVPDPARPFTDITPVGDRHGSTEVDEKSRTQA